MLYTDAFNLSHTYAHKNRELRVEWRWLWVRLLGNFTSFWYFCSKLIFSCCFFFFISRSLSVWSPICSVNDMCGVKPYARHTTTNSTDLSIESNHSKHFHRDEENKRKEREQRQGKKFYKRILAISLEVIQCLKIDQHRNCHPLSDYYCINTISYGWIYCDISMRCVCALPSMKLLRVLNGKKGRIKENIYCKHKLGDWPMIWSIVAKYLFRPNDALLCGSTFYECSPFFSVLFFSSSACSGRNSEVINAFNQIKIHLDHSVLSPHVCVCIQFGLLFFLLCLVLTSIFIKK